MRTAFNQLFGLPTSGSARAPSASGRACRPQGRSGCTSFAKRNLQVKDTRDGAVRAPGIVARLADIPDIGCASLRAMHPGKPAPQPRGVFQQPVKRAVSGTVGSNRRVSRQASSSNTRVDAGLELAESHVLPVHPHQTDLPPVAVYLGQSAISYRWKRRTPAARLRTNRHEWSLCGGPGMALRSGRAVDSWERAGWHHDRPTVGNRLNLHAIKPERSARASQRIDSRKLDITLSQSGVSSGVRPTGTLECAAA